MRLMTTTPAGTLRRALTGGHTFLGLLAWSRDERWILFKGQRFGARSVDLWVVRVTTGLTRRLAVGAWIGSFAPDSKHVVYSAPKGGLFVVSVDGRSRRRLSADGADPQWSPDGSWISFRSSVGIELLRPDGTDRHPLLGP
jgi:Tol biopolymer transport system component